MYRSSSRLSVGPGDRGSRASSLTRSSSLSRSASFSPGYLNRNASTVFGRALSSASYSRTPPLHSVAVQRSTPHYMDRYPYVRYSYGNVYNDAGSTLVSQGSRVKRDHYSVRDQPLSKYLSSSYSLYSTNLRGKPTYVSSPRQSYTKYMPVEEAVEMYKNRCMTVGTLSKYWLSPGTWKTRREREYNLGRSSTDGTYSYTTRYTARYF